MLGGGYSNQNSSGTSDLNSTTGQTGGLSRTFAPGTGALPSTFAGYLQKLFTNPESAVQPAQTQARNQVNQNYTGAADALRQQFMSGSGASGKNGLAQTQLQVGRAGALSDVDQAAATQAASMPMTAASLATQLLGATSGASTTGTSTTQQLGATTGNSSGFNLGAQVG